MDYEQKYKDALKRAKKLYEQGTITESLGYVFPELKESEDERIRKWCISHFNACINVIKDNDEYKEYLSNKVIAWLEKQGEQKDLIAEIKNRKALLGAEKEKAVSSTDKLSLGARIAMLDELLAWVKKQGKENNTYTINNTPNCGISVHNEELKESEEERIKKILNWHLKLWNDD